MRLDYPTNVKVIKVPCTGRVDIIMVLKANLRAKKRVGYLKKLLEEVGIETDRIEMYNLSSSSGPRFAEIAREVTEKIRALGPSPIKKAKAKTQFQA